MVVELKLFCKSQRPFCWFSYFDRFHLKGEVYGIEINPGIQFYSPTTGETLCVKEKCTLAILEKFGGKDQIVKNLTKSKKVCGFVEVDVTSSKRRKKTKFIPNLFHNELTFYFRNRSLLTSCNRECKLLLYAKKYNDMIRSQIPDFPTYEYIQNTDNPTGLCMKITQMLGFE